MKPGEIAQQLTTFNSWWQNPGWEARDVQLSTARASRLDYAPDVLDDIPEGALVLLRGPRRVGKSVALKRYVATRLAGGTPARAIIHAAVDGWRSADLRTLVATGKRLAPPGTRHRWWLLDEISAVDGWAPVIKNLRDNDPDFANDTVILTSSAAHDLTSATSQLAGRRGSVSRPDRTLLPMGFRAFFDLVAAASGSPPPAVPQLSAQQLRSPEAAAAVGVMIPWLSDLVGYWEVYLAFGGFPQAVSAYLRGESFQPLVQALFDVVQRDAFGASTITEAQTFRMLARLSENLCSPLSVSSVAQDLGLGADTLSRRLDDLGSAYFLWPCPSSDRLVPRSRAQSKRYFTDPLLARLAHLRNPTYPEPDLTRLSEMQLGNTLLRSIERATPGSYASFDQLLYERTPTRKEIDFVGPELTPVAIEGKYTDSGNWTGEAATINASSYSGILATRSVLDTSANGPEQSWAVPVSFLAYLLGT